MHAQHPAVYERLQERAQEHSIIDDGRKTYAAAWGMRKVCEQGPGASRAMQ